MSETRERFLEIMGKAISQATEQELERLLSFGEGYAFAQARQEVPGKAAGSRAAPARESA